MSRQSPRRNSPRRKSPRRKSLSRKTRSSAKKRSYRGARQPLYRAHMRMRTRSMTNAANSENGLKRPRSPSPPPPPSELVKVPSPEEIVKELNQLSDIHNYHNMITPMLKVLFRFSRVPRRGNDTLDFDIVQIVIHEPYRNQGNGTQFFKNVMKAAKTFGRGVFLEQCITKASQGLRRRLIENGLATPFEEEIYGPFLALSIKE